MAVSGVSPEVQAELAARLGELLVKQSWWKRYANTVTAAVTNLLNVVWLVVSLGIHMDTWLIWTVAAILFAGNVLGIKKTPNGLTPSLVDLIAGQVAGRHRA